MKKQLRYLLFLLPLLAHAQFNTFEDGTLNNWTNSDGTTNGLTNEVHAIPDPLYNGDFNYLRKTSDGSNTAAGSMSIKSLDFLEGDLFIAGAFGFPAVDSCEFMVRNSNSFDLHLRIVLTGINNAKIVSTDAFIVPANSDWIIGGFPLNIESNIFTLFPGSATNVDLQSVLETVTSTEIIHSTTLATEGEHIAGLLEIDTIGYYLLLSVEEQFLQAIKVFPNPVQDQLFVNFPQSTKGTLTLTSIDGKQLFSKNINTDKMQIDMSNIQAKGMYFLQITTPKGTLTKKIVKS
ncbi:T9SS type A sorting domain-containing protein [Kordia jejudonensis]|uniref:T9SS type A sorting domain-containing protein n=1 Tax=Kordia jejudonensis TaxID=1348245 RepID=UPI000629B59E|nr:T9SS type A sorting domain-containing protein [Kordia jejudonensis]